MLGSFSSLLELRWRGSRMPGRAPGRPRGGLAALVGSAGQLPPSPPPARDPIRDGIPGALSPRHSRPRARGSMLALLRIAPRLSCAASRTARLRGLRLRRPVRITAPGDLRIYSPTVFEIDMNFSSHSGESRVEFGEPHGTSAEWARGLAAVTSRRILPPPAVAWRGARTACDERRETAASGLRRVAPHFGTPRLGSPEPASGRISLAQRRKGPVCGPPRRRGAKKWGRT